MASSKTLISNKFKVRESIMNKVFLQQIFSKDFSSQIIKDKVKKKCSNCMFKQEKEQDRYMKKETIS